MKKYFKLIACLVAIASLFAFIGVITNSNNSKVIEEPKISIPATTAPASVVTKKTEVVQTKHTVAKLLSDDEIRLIALCTMGEAEGEPDSGKRLVIDTILNRVDSDGFPDNVDDVIYQPNAFECMWNGRIENCFNNPDYVEIMDHISQLVEEEAFDRKNVEVTYFCAYGYSDYGTPLFKVGNHYFSRN